MRRPTYKVPQRDAAADEPEEHDEAGHAQDEQPCSARIVICATISEGPKVTIQHGCTYSQLLRAHQRVKRKKTAMQMDAILLAFVLNPQAMSAAPMRDEPR